jgi:hypothetical protein
MTISQLRRELRCSYVLLVGLFAEYGIDLRRRGRTPGYEFQLTEGLFDVICREGVSYVAAKIGLSYTQLHRHLVTDPRVKEWNKKYEGRLEKS